MTIAIDLTGMTTPKEFHKKIGQVLSLPDWYGNNLDALYDVLSMQPELSVYFLNAAELRAAAPNFASALECMCNDLSAETPKRLCVVKD